jgi:hypothetical protein
MMVKLVHMRLIILGLYFIASISFADDTIYPKDAMKYLKKLDCRFSAFAVYTGKDMSSDLGSLKHGQAYSRAICIASYAEGGAKRHDYCWLRAVDMKDGVYVGTATYGDAWRDETGLCTKESILRILNKGYIKNQLLFGKDKEWKVVSDTRGVTANFKKMFEKPKVKIGPYFKYRWQYYPASGQCIEEPGEADQEFLSLKGSFKNMEKSESDSRLVLGTRTNSVKSRFYISKGACESDASK